MFLKLLLNGLLYILVMAMIASTNKNARVKWRSAIDIRSSNCLVPLHYNLHITLKPKYLYSGEVNATIFINCATHNIILHISKNIILMQVKLKSSNSGISYTPTYSFYAEKEEYVVLNFGDQFLPEYNLECGFYTLYVEFLNLLPQYNSRELLQTWYTNERRHEKSIITTLIQPRRARQLFPCWDKPKLSATFNISVKHKINNKVLSNAPIREYESMDDNWMRTLFHTTPHMSTNDIAIIMYDVDEFYQVFNSTVFDPTKIVVNTWCRSHLIPHMKFAQYVAGNVTMYLENNWKMLKNVPKVDYVAIPNFENKIWQTWGLVFYNESDIIYNEELHPAALKTTVMRSIAHDITYQWFGDLFSPSHWWLNEGFIMFLETYIIDQAFLDSRMMDLFVVQVQHESRHLNTHHFAINDTIGYTRNISEINSPFPLSQIIGGFVWRMLKTIIFDNVFWTYINTYLKSKIIYYNSNTPDHLWNIMQIHVINKNSEGCDLNVKQMMNIWTVEEHSPVINVTRDYSSGRVKISIEFHGKMDRKSYFIPVTYTEETNINFDIRFPNIHCLTQSNPEVEVQLRYNDNWIIVNLQQIGCYRVNYDPGNWQRIARYLNSENYTKIHVLNRAQIIDDAFHLAIEKKLNLSIFWELASYLSREKDYIAWYPMIKAFEYISNIFAFSKTDQHVKKVLVKIESLFKHIEKHVYNQTMVHTKDDLSKCLQQELAKWGCIIDNSFCKEMASNQLQLYLENPEKNKILPGWQKWTYCNGLKTANSDTWHQLLSIAFSIYKEKSDYKMLEFLSCFEDPVFINYYPQFFMPAFERYLFEYNGNKPSAQEKGRFYAITANIFLSTLARHAKNTIILTKILNNFENIKNSRVSMNAALSVMINNAYSKEQLDEIRQFAKKDMQQSLSNIEHKLRTRSLEIQNQLNFLQSLFEEPNTVTSIVRHPTTTRRPKITTIYKKSAKEFTDIINNLYEKYRFMSARRG